MQTFEPDQLVLVRYIGNKVWRLKRYSFFDGQEHETQDGATFSDKDILPYAGNEHLLGTTESPAPKWKPKLGELVAVSDTGEEDDWEPCIYKGKSGDPEMPFRAARLTPRNRRAYTWVYCEPIRKHFYMPE